MKPPTSLLFLLKIAESDVVVEPTQVDKYAQLSNPIIKPQVVGVKIRRNIWNRHQV